MSALVESGAREGKGGGGVRCVSALVEFGARGDKGAGQALCVRFGGVGHWGRCISMPQSFVLASAANFYHLIRRGVALSLPLFPFL